MLNINLNFGGSFSWLRKPVCCWLLGFFFGVLLYLPSKPFFASMMLRVIETPMSIDGLLTAYFLPFLIGVAACCFGFSYLLLTVCFIKAFSFGYLACALIQCLYCGWFLLPLLFFSDFVVGFVLLWLCSALNDRASKFRFGVSAALVIAAASIDYLLISPFLSAIVI